jgi:damage-control phosphatase, subfamily I
MKHPPVNKALPSPAFAPHLDCVPCLMRQAREAIGYAGVQSSEGFEVLREVLQLMARLDWKLPPPVLGQQVHWLIRRLTRCDDPYAQVKKRLNRKAARLYPAWRRRFHQQHPPMEAAVRLAIVGNLLDVGAKTRMDDGAIRAAFTDALTAPLQGSSVADFTERVRRADSILYLADNAGEIFFDRDLISQLPAGKVAVAVRGSPVLNDATCLDAQQAGLADRCEIISNGSDAPGTILSDCSPEFQTRFETADLVIAKGQGNYESLFGADRDIFFLLKVKCDVLARALNFPIGSLVLYRKTRLGRTARFPTPVRIQNQEP